MDRPTEPTSSGAYDGPLGWYSSPGEPDTLRYWDGFAWTDQRRPTPAGERERSLVLIPVLVTVLGLLAAVALILTR
jgi:Protein of unknown function (DUF2510)